MILYSYPLIIIRFPSELLMSFTIIVLIWLGHEVLNALLVCQRWLDCCLIQRCLVSKQRPWCLSKVSFKHRLLLFTTSNNTWIMMIDMLFYLSNNMTWNISTSVTCLLIGMVLNSYLVLLVLSSHHRLLYHIALLIISHCILSSLLATSLDLLNYALLQRMLLIALQFRLNFL